MTRYLTSIGWVLLGLLVIAGGVIWAGRQDVKAFPAADSFSPSGTSALFTLLKERGYRVELDRSPHPKLNLGDVAIAFHVRSDSLNVSDEGETRHFWERAEAAGAIVFWLRLGENFQDASLTARNPQTLARGLMARQISTEFNAGSYSLLPEGAVPILKDAGPQGGVSSWAVPRGKGYEVGYEDAIGLTNRFLDHADNAQVFLETLGGFAKPGARVVFTEASFGNSRPIGLLRTIGVWAEAAWFQLLFLFIVIIFTLNRRFGLPEEYRPPQRGTRDLLNAITDTLTRAKASGATLDAAGGDAEWRLRRALKLPRDAGLGELYRLLPESLIKAMSAVRAAEEMPETRPPQAFRLIQTLEAELDEFLQTRKPQATRRRLKQAWKQQDQ